MIVGQSYAERESNFDRLERWAALRALYIGLSEFT